MDSKNLKLSEIKANIQHVLVNLEQLEQLSNEAGQDFDVQQAEELQRRTSTLLDELEKRPGWISSGVREPTTMSCASRRRSSRSAS